MSCGECIKHQENLHQKTIVKKYLKLHFFYVHRVRVRCGGDRVMCKIKKLHSTTFTSYVCTFIVYLLDYGVAVVYPILVV